MIMRPLQTILALASLLFLNSCGGGGNPASTSSGLKIFVTSRIHNGNFINDPTLTGDTAIAKADNFCQTDPNRPSNATYKALLVDGNFRDAVKPVDWVLKPNTVYYQPTQDVRIGLTTSTAVFATSSIFLDHSISDNSRSVIWTGLAEASTFSTSEDTCQGWTTSLNPYFSTIGVAYGNDASAFATNGGHSCTFAYPLYCVEQ